MWSTWGVKKKLKTLKWLIWKQYLQLIKIALRKKNFLDFHAEANSDYDKSKF